jgi:hypothetical protein
VQVKRGAQLARENAAALAARDDLCTCGRSREEHTPPRVGGACASFRKAEIVAPKKHAPNLPEYNCSYCGKPARKGSLLIDGQTAHKSCYKFYEAEAERR